MNLVAIFLSADIVLHFAVFFLNICIKYLFDTGIVYFNLFMCVSLHKIGKFKLFNNIQSGTQMNDSFNDISFDRVALVEFITHSAISWIAIVYCISK